MRLLLLWGKLKSYFRILVSKSMNAIQYDFLSCFGGLLETVDIVPQKRSIYINEFGKL